MLETLGFISILKGRSCCVAVFLIGFILPNVLYSFITLVIDVDIFKLKRESKKLIT